MSALLSVPIGDIHYCLNGLGPVTSSTCQKIGVGKQAEPTALSLRLPLTTRSATSSSPNLHSLVNLFELQELFDSLPNSHADGCNANGIAGVLRSTFPKFLCDPQLCTNPAFHITRSESHAHLLSRCLESMKLDKEFESRTKVHKETYPIETSPSSACLPRRLILWWLTGTYYHILEHIQYACDHWHNHL